MIQQMLDHRNLENSAVTTGLEKVNFHSNPKERQCQRMLNYSTTVWPQVNNREGTQPRPSTENWIKDLLSTAPPIRTRPSFPLSQSLPLGSFNKPHPSPSEGRQTENHNHRKLTNLIKWTTALSNSMKL